jgi:hypothetical protein
MQRDHNWLKFRLETIWRIHFQDIAVANNVFVKFGRPCRTRLGSIKFGRKQDDPNTIITINGYFKDEFIPETVVDAVLAHELTHYAQGFCSPHEQKFANPHQGGVVNRELSDRGLRELLHLEKRWVKANWRNYLIVHERLK